MHCVLLGRKWSPSLELLQNLPRDRRDCLLYRNCNEEGPNIVCSQSNLIANFFFGVPFFSVI